jgi:hypothetical protein
MASHWTFTQAALFAIGTMSTAGLVSPTIDNDSVIFVGVFMIFGVLSFGLTLGGIADYFSQKELNRLTKMKLVTKTTPDDLMTLQTHVQLSILASCPCFPSHILVACRSPVLDSGGPVGNVRVLRVYLTSRMLRGWLRGVCTTSKVR